MEEVAIKVENVVKLYKLYDKPSDRLKESLGLTKQKRYKEHYALNGLDFEVKKGECIGIIGTNGAGKSTILKIITGVLNPTEGNITINGRISALLELGAGFNMEYTGIENVYLNGTMLGFSKEEIDRKLDDILEFADIGDFVNQPVKTYSSGMFVRLAFAVAINIDPEILIVDEALSVGDVFFQAKCFKKFEEFKKMGKTILFVSHDLSSISRYCDRVILLNKGEKIAEGSAGDMIDLYKKVLVGQYDATAPESSESEQKESKNVTEKMSLKLNINPDLSEYGNKEVEIIDYAIMDENGIITNSVEKGKCFSIVMVLKYNIQTDEAIYAYTIRDIRGTDLTGTNTMYERIDLGHRKVGDVQKVVFRQKMNLQGGEYLLSLGCTAYRNNKFEVFHRLYDVCNITVVSDKNTVGYFDMDSEIEINNL